MQNADASRRGRVRRFAIGGAGLVAMLTAVASVGTLGASAQQEPQVTLCHATSAESNPYGPQPITVDQSAVFNNGVVPNGHGTHTGPIFPATEGDPPHWGDIIPPFGDYPGLNATPEGLAILENGCQIPPPVTTTTAAPVTPQVAPPAAPAPPPRPVAGPPRFTG